MYFLGSLDGCLDDWGVEESSGDWAHLVLNIVDDLLELALADASVALDVHPDLAHPPLRGVGPLALDIDDDGVDLLALLLKDELDSVASACAEAHEDIIWWGWSRTVASGGEDALAVLVCAEPLETVDALGADLPNLGGRTCETGAQHHKSEVTGELAGYPIICLKFERPSALQTVE